MKFILVINAGSSSLKFELFDAKTLASVFEGKFEEIGSGKNTHEKALKKAAALLSRKLPRKEFLRADIAAIGHRVVHGGEKYFKPARITNTVISDIKKFSSLAPLHNPANLACIMACKKLFPGIPQVACFDTAFHQTIPQKTFLYALPIKLYKRYGIRRYGFHGLSHEYVFNEAEKKLGREKTRRVITCHLGNGCSLTAIRNGKSVDTTMGFTPLEGVPMGTRSGDIDPSIIFFLIRMGLPAKKIERMLNFESGLKGMSGISSDIRILLGKNLARIKIAARLAIEVFCYRTAKAITGLTAALGGLDCLVFTGGIGENSSYIRKKILSQIPFKNFKTLIIKTDEEKYIARLTKILIY